MQWNLARNPRKQATGGAYQAWNSEFGVLQRNLQGSLFAARCLSRGVSLAFPLPSASASAPVRHRHRTAQHGRYRSTFFRVTFQVPSTVCHCPSTHVTTIRPRTIVSRLIQTASSQWGVSSIRMTAIRIIDRAEYEGKRKKRRGK